MEKYRNSQKDCDKAKLNEKGFCKWCCWDSRIGLVLCTNKEDFTFKVNLYCPHLIVN